MGLEGAPRLCDVARAHSDCPVVCGNLCAAAAALGPAQPRFDGKRPSLVATLKPLVPPQRPPACAPP